jgi:DNA polymerase III epsilon subunit-like protein
MLEKIDKLIFIDTETTGLNPATHEIIELGVVLVDPITLNEFDQVSYKVLPQRISAADEHALAMNHYSFMSWQQAKPFQDEAGPYISSLSTPKSIICGHNIKFDVAFLESMFSRYAPDLPFVYGGTLDTQTLAKKLAVATPSYRLSILCQKFGVSIDVEKQHSALYDILANVELFKSMFRNYDFDLSEAIVMKSYRKTPKKKTATTKAVR